MNVSPVSHARTPDLGEPASLAKEQFSEVLNVEGGDSWNISVDHVLKKSTRKTFDALVDAVLTCPQLKRKHLEELLDHTRLQEDFGTVLSSKKNASVLFAHIVNKVSKTPQLLTDPIGVRIVSEKLVQIVNSCVLRGFGLDCKDTRFFTIQSLLLNSNCSLAVKEPLNRLISLSLNLEKLPPGSVEIDDDSSQRVTLRPRLLPQTCRKRSFLCPDA